MVLELFHAVGQTIAAPTGAPPSIQVMGVQLPLLLLLRFGLTVSVVLIYAAVSSNRETEDQQISRFYTLILVSFVTDHHRTVKDVAAVVGERGMEHEDARSLVTQLGELKAAGSLPDSTNFAKTGMRESLLFMATAPLAGVAMPFIYQDEIRAYHFLIEHTEYRRAGFTKAVLIASTLLLLLFALLTVVSKIKWASILVVTIFSPGLLGSIVVCGQFVWSQRGWKAYWQRKLLEIMAVASKDNNHDLFNRAMNLRSFVASQPEVPLPGNFAFYGAVYSIAQLVLAISFRLFHLSG